MRVTHDWQVSTDHESEALPTACQRRYPLRLAASYDIWCKQTQISSKENRFITSFEVFTEMEYSVKTHHRHQ